MLYTLKINIYRMKDKKTNIIINLLSFGYLKNIYVKH